MHFWFVLLLSGTIVYLFFVALFGYCWETLIFLVLLVSSLSSIWSLFSSYMVVIGGVWICLVLFGPFGHF